MHCPTCQNPIPRTSPKANNKKFCSVACRNKDPANKAKRKAHSDKHNDLASKARAEYDPEKLQCKICNKWYIKLCSHTYHAHGITAKEYKEEHGYNNIAGLVSKGYHDHKSELVLSRPEIIHNNLIESGKKTRFKKGDPTLGLYKRRPETLEVLKNNYKKTWKQK